MKRNQGKYVIGVDGGGTKTIVALADLGGNILDKAEYGPSNPRKVGTEVAVVNIASGIRQVLKSRDKKILSTFIGLAAVQEEGQLKKEIKAELFKQKGISPIFKGKVEIDSDQIVAFRSGTDEKIGIVLISGTGCVAHGWHNGEEAKTSGWGHLTDEGSAFWIGQRGIQAVFKDLDGRGSKTLITKLAFKKWKVGEVENLMREVYSEDLIKIVPVFSILVDMAAKKRDKVAKDILTEAGVELALAAKAVIKKLNFQKKKFPLVLVGSVFEAKVFLNIVKKEIKKIAPKAQFIQPKQEPVIGAVKLALEGLEE
ncbi:hypothetical protein KKB68_02210 [Patescibacteria group bacterium]|nr:hypothetical protein [Patescibacteria group bacterium]